MSNSEANTETDAGRMIRMFELARTMSEAAKGRDAQGNENPGIDFEKMLTFMEAYKTINAANQGNGAEPAADDFDARLNTSDIVTMKSVMPYLAPDQRKTLAIALKLMEIQRLVEYCREMKERAAREGTGDQTWTVALLDYAKKSLEPAGQARIELLIEFVKISDITRRLKEMELNERR